MALPWHCALPPRGHPAAAQGPPPDPAGDPLGRLAAVHRAQRREGPPRRRHRWPGEGGSTARRGGIDGRVPFRAPPGVPGVDAGRSGAGRSPVAAVPPPQTSDGGGAATTSMGAGGLEEGGGRRGRRRRDAGAPSHPCTRRPYGSGGRPGPGRGGGLNSTKSHGRPGLRLDGAESHKSRPGGRPGPRPNGCPSPSPTRVDPSPTVKRFRSGRFAAAWGVRGRERGGGGGPGLQPGGNGSSTGGDPAFHLRGWPGPEPGGNETQGATRPSRAGHGGRAAHCPPVPCAGALGATRS